MNTFLLFAFMVISVVKADNSVLAGPLFEFAGLLSTISGQNVKLAAREPSIRFFLKLEGVSQQAWNDAGATSCILLAETVSQSANGTIRSSQVANCEARSSGSQGPPQLSPSATSLRLRSVRYHRRLQQQPPASPNELDVTFVITLPSSSSESAAQSIIDQLNYAITSGVFTTILRAAATQLSVPAFGNAVVSTDNSSSAEITGFSTRSQPKEPFFNRAVVAGIAVACALLAISIAALVHFLQTKHKREVLEQAAAERAAAYLAARTPSTTGAGLEMLGTRQQVTRPVERAPLAAATANAGHREQRIVEANKHVHFV